MYIIAALLNCSLLHHGLSRLYIISSVLFCTNYKDVFSIIPMFNIGKPVSGTNFKSLPTGGDTYNEETAQDYSGHGATMVND